MFWVPGDNVVAFSKLRKPLQDWIAKGMMRAPEGPVVNYLDVGNFIKNCMEVYDLRLIAWDSWKLEFFAAKVGDWFETIASKFSQSMKSMTLPIDQFKEAYLTGMITSGGNPIMTWMMDCVESSTDTNGNAKLVKPKLERSKTRIDGVISSIMSFNTAVDNEGQGNLDAKEDFVFF
jgi:phage terminase large subunit-like protein